MVLGIALNQVRGSLAGSLTVDHIGSPTLFRGATLRGVRLEAEGGRRFLEADSLHVRYSVLSLFGPRPRIASLTLFRPTVEISTLPGEEGPNVTRLLVPGPDPDSARSAGSFRVGRVRVRDGLLAVLTPTESSAGSRVPTVLTPDGDGRLRRLGLEGIDLELRDVVLSLGSAETLEARLTALAMDVGVLDEPLRVTGVEGTLRFGDAGLRVDSAEFRFPGSAFDGDLALGPGPEGTEGWRFELDLRSTGPAALADVGWLDPRIPSGTFSGDIGVSVGGGVGVELGNVRLELDGSQVDVDGRVELARGMVLRDMEIQASPLSLARLEPWFATTFPFDGWLSGTVHLSGRPEALDTDGTVTFVPVGYGGLPSTAEFAGTIHVSSDPGATGFQTIVDPLNVELLDALRPGLGLTGDARLRLEASGRVEEGIRFTAEMNHGESEAVASHVLLGGSIFRSGQGRWITDVSGDLSPLSVGLFAGLAPDLGLQGVLAGVVRGVGPLDDLRVTADLTSGPGAVTLDGDVDVLSPGRQYRIDARLTDLPLSDLVSRLPEPSAWTGRIEVEGGGIRTETLQARAVVSATTSRVGGLHVEQVTASLAAAGGLLALDTLDALLGGVHVVGSGEWGLTETSSGTVALSFSTPSLMGLRPLFRGDSVLARDELSPLDEHWLTLEGIDVDTLPAAADVAMQGVAEGHLEISGWVGAVDVSGELSVANALYGRDALGRIEMQLEATDVTAPERVVGVGFDAHDVEVAGRTFEDVGAELTFEGTRGTGSVAIVRAGEERYDLSGSFMVDSLGGGELSLDQATFEIDSLSWHLVRPAEATWDRDGTTLRDVEIARSGGDPMNLTAEGRLGWSGSSDLRVDAVGLHLDRLGRLAQWPDSLVSGRVDLSLDVVGPATAPFIDATFRVREPRYSRVALSDLSGQLHYRDRSAEVNLVALEGPDTVFRAEGRVPIDLSLRPEGARMVRRPMDVEVVADSLDAAVVLTSLGFLEDVDGWVSGEFRIRGTPEEPEPSGLLRLVEGAWSIGALGVRHQGVGGTLALAPDGTVEVSLATRVAGTSTVEGQVVLDPVTDPGLDLAISFADFEAVNRRDVAGHISGETRLQGTYRAPLLDGSLTVDHGTLFLEEFARSAQVVDLTDPRFFDLMVDTARFSGQPLIAGISNPFLQNLRVAVDLSVPRDTWLRSEDTNVEIGGSLLVSYDRLQRDLVMVGELEALRGSYLVLGRRFEVEGGVVGFIGTPGINPTLDIQAVSRIRRMEGEPLDVSATVAGTLTQPRVTLSSDEQGVAESDLVSYLIFGRPSYELASGQEALVQGAASSFVRTTAQAGVTWAAGTLANQLGAAVAQEIGVDYLSITQAGDFGVMTGSFTGPLAGTQIEIGQYLGEDAFFVLIFRPRPEPGTGQGYFAGARGEIALTDQYNVQGFWEDRFLRGRAGAFGDLPFQAAQVLGVFIFREWGY
jgi:hypothetical protein